MSDLGGGSSTRHILVVEDDLVIARLIQRGFVRLGYSVEVATSCADASALDGAFRCGVFDIELRDGDGVALAEALVARGSVGAVVFYTGSLDPDARQRALAVGRVIDKLSPFGDLGSHVAALVGENHPGKA